MKCIEINSKKYGLFKILVDDEDFKKIEKYKWSINLDNGNFYAGANIGGKRKRLHRVILGLSDPEQGFAMPPE